jgi:hypothetical protein
VFTQSRRIVLVALAFAVAGGWSTRGHGQDAPKPDAAPPAGPEPLKPVELLPVLKTVPVRQGMRHQYNINMVDATLLPRDKPGIWVLNFAFKPLRMRTVEVPGKGRRQIHYLYYRVVNRTGKPRELVPQFTLITDTGKRYEEAVLPAAVAIIRAREDASVPVLGAVDIAGVIPPSTKDGIDDAVYGVAMWDHVDPKADHMQIYVRGLSDGYKDVPGPDGSAPVARYKTLRIDLTRRGDDRNLNEREIELNEPPYEWIYW